MPGLLGAADVFTTRHIGSTAALTAAVALVAGFGIARSRARGCWSPGPSRAAPATAGSTGRGPWPWSLRSR